MAPPGGDFFACSGNADNAAMTNRNSSLSVVSRSSVILEENDDVTKDQIQVMTNQAESRILDQL